MLHWVGEIIDSLGRTDSFLSMTASNVNSACSISWTATNEGELVQMVPDVPQNLNDEPTADCQFGVSVAVSVWRYK